MLSQVNVTSAQGEILQLVLADVSDGFVLEDIGGLGPVKATLVSTGFANQDGVQPQSAKREQRDLSFKIGLEPYDTSMTVQQLRQQLYDFFMGGILARGEGPAECGLPHGQLVAAVVAAADNRGGHERVRQIRDER